MNALVYAARVPASICAAPRPLRDPAAPGSSDGVAVWCVLRTTGLTCPARASPPVGMKTQVAQLLHCQLKLLGVRRLPQRVATWDRNFVFEPAPGKAGGAVFGESER